MNDLLHCNKYHGGISTPDNLFGEVLQPYVLELIKHASARGADVNSKHPRRLLALLDLWEEKGYYTKECINELRDFVRLGNRAQEGVAQTSRGTADEPNDERKDTPFIMPSIHGDSSTPFFDLPAGNMMPHIIPNSSNAINPQLVKPLELVAGPADENLTEAVKDLIKDIASLYGTASGQDYATILDIDALGQPTIRDETNGEFFAGSEGYYGWSKAFCER